MQRVSGVLLLLLACIPVLRLPAACGSALPALSSLQSSYTSLPAVLGTAATAAAVITAPRVQAAGPDQAQPYHDDAYAAERSLASRCACFVQ
jgi:hypothetical protein